MVANPYTAVPQALEKTRLTLRDIMNDYVGTKVQESKHKLALAELDLETRGLELRGKREERRLGIDLARLTSDQQFREKQLGEMTRSREAGEQFREKQLGEMTRSREAGEQFREKQLALRTRSTEAAERVSELKADALLKQQKRIDRQEALLNKEDTYGNWITGSARLDPDLKKLMEKYTAKEEWDRPYSGRQMQEKWELLKTNHPRFFFENVRRNARRRLDDIAAKLKDKNLPMEQRERLFQEQFLPASRDLETLKMTIGDSKAITTKDKEHLEEQAIKMVENGIAPTYEEAYQKLISIRKAYWDDKSSEEDIRKSLGLKGPERTGKAAGKLSFKLPEKDEKRFMDKINEIERKYGPEKANRAMQAFIRRTPKAEDLEHGFTLLDTVLREKQGKKKAKQEREKGILRAGIIGVPTKKKAPKEDLSISPEEHVPTAASREDLDKITDKIEKEANKIKKDNPHLHYEEALQRAKLKEGVLSLPKTIMKAVTKRYKESEKGLKKEREEHKRKARERGKLQLRTLFQ